MTPDELRKLFPNISEDCIRKTLSVGSVAMPKREQSSPSPLDSKLPRRNGRSRSLVVVISLVSFRKRILDDDNLIAGFKPLRDAIAASLNVDDADPRIRWQYGQQRTDGEQGTIVLIERV